MDRFLYLAMSGAKENLYAQAINNHNLANANTHGFRQALGDAYTVPVRGPVYDSRDYVQVRNEAIDFSFGAEQSTGRDLDIAIQGEGFIAVQAPDGGEAYTRSGNLHVDVLGVLRTERGLVVLGGGGPITVPPNENLLIGTDGTITIRPGGSGANTLTTIERIRLVNPDVKTLVRTENGLIRAGDGQAQPADANVRVVTGMLETSNVNTVAALTQMIELSRHFEMQIKMMESANNVEQTHNRLLGIG
ncbi:flagellar basal body rod protein FlgF [Chromatium okenii]|jgi:flagellar basal-body rod protein FlgF|uniref:Flagellar basal-body rod protein FlgF n=1 Tax=Chromatium okenii TaxID=61644 RepID=A0A2S7XNN2_9GAMM|nr:flagellar basal body rod protein FlgF [Chromatium okenii]PQJ95276.1 flagellar biosynthesis protein FlgF [Chromatium okenii]